MNEAKQDIHEEYISSSPCDSILSTKRKVITASKDRHTKTTPYTLKVGVGLPQLLHPLQNQVCNRNN